ncbi:hypothetical protein BD410DRAFT_827317 [Rickenella mellea]|uniref:Extracellular membrane protein CFEM domain-containing protein n=1 Tax=Rickenella mellea TaxID=50990 RepID=A0A4Y7QC07_9AGAM|nr:hypothetical protein BD410DRAFT_827317 [Rickenella mellea]
MSRVSFAVVVTLTLAARAFAVAGASHGLTVLSRSLHARQSFAPGSIPPQCSQPCSAINQTITSCPDLACLCTTAVATQVADCADCIVAISGVPASQEQSIVDQFNNACKTNGASVSSVQVSSVAPSGATGGSSPSTAAGTGTGTSKSNVSPTGSGTSAGAGATTSPSSGAADIWVGPVEVFIERTTGQKRRTHAGVEPGFET